MLSATAQSSFLPEDQWHKRIGAAANPGLAQRASTLCPQAAPQPDEQHDEP
jgi:hypothetical protein